MTKRRSLVSLLTACLAMSACATLGEGSTSRLDLIGKRGELRCGVSGKIPGFSFLQRDGRYAGLDVDLCKAFAAAIAAARRNNPSVEFGK